MNFLPCRNHWRENSTYFNLKAKNLRYFLPYKTHWRENYDFKYSDSTSFNQKTVFFAVQKSLERKSHILQSKSQKSSSFFCIVKLTGEKIMTSNIQMPHPSIKKLYFLPCKNHWRENYDFKYAFKYVIKQVLPISLHLKIFLS